jgi:Large ribosomal RNA subunit accumulation protein YceD
MTVELHRPVIVSRIPAGGLDVVVEASAAECSALALRMDVPEVRSLRCEFQLTALSSTIVAAKGFLRATVVQTCVISAEPFEAAVEERFSVRFVPLGTEQDDPDPDSEDEIPYEHGVVDVGEAAAEQLGLALDPYPRAPGAELPDLDDGANAGPFVALGKLQNRN